jgi:membrane protein
MERRPSERATGVPSQSSADPTTRREEVPSRISEESRSAPEPNTSRLAVVRRAVRAFRRHHLTTAAAALAYYAFLSIPSALLIAVGLFSLFAGPPAITTVIGKLNHLVPSQATSLLQGSLQTLTRRQTSGITVLAIGGALALWSLTGAMESVMWGTNMAYGVEEQRSFLRRRLIALGMIGFALVGFALLFGTLVLGPHLAKWIGNAAGSRSAVETIWWVANWPILVAGLLLAFAGVMYLAPNHDRRRWRFFSFGSILALAIWLVVSGAFAFYVSRFGSYNKTWGSLSAVVVMLVWLWLSSVALLLGAEVDAEAERSREPSAAGPST